MPIRGGMAKRVIIRIEISPQAKNRVNELSRQNGMTQVAMTSRMIEWFAGQSELIQAAVLGRYPKEIEVDIAKLILQRMAGKRE
jgi:methyl coenzyme M reductase beta subunit